MTYDALLLASFGGPEGPDDVMPFLVNVTRGRGIPRERLEAVAEHYYHLGGVSPINAQNRDLMSELEAEFARRGIELPIYFGNRNWEPYFTDALRQIADDGHRRVLALATSAYSSYSGCRQYRENLAQALIETDLHGTITMAKVRHYFDHPGFVAASVAGVAAALNDVAQQGISVEATRVLFTTHSVPTSMSEASGPPAGSPGHIPGGAYVAQHLAVAEVVMAQVAEVLAGPVPPHRLVFQSRSGPPTMPWLEPDINDAMREAAAQGVQAFVVVPVGFISDHVEVIWDLDHEARDTADELGTAFLRVPTAGVHPAFVSGLVDIVEESLRDRPAEALTDLGPWPSLCAIGCCPNARADLPTVAGADSTIGR